MLEPGERIDNHDKVCCEYYATLLAMGAYDDEFALFGTVYLKEGRRQSFISTSRAKVYEFFEDCLEKQIYPTVVEAKIRRLRVHAGEKSQIEQQLKLEFARELGQRYSRTFLEDLQKQALCPSNNQAADILEPLRAQLEGCFDEDALQLFEGAVQYAYAGKVLTHASYYQIKDWLKRERDFLTEKKHPACNLQREAAGFGCLDGGKIIYYTNALEEKAAARRIEQMSKGYLTTPIYKKKYYLNSYSELPACLKHFDQEIRQKINAPYLELIKDLQALKPEMDQERFVRLEQQCKNDDRGVINTLGYYKTLWHLR